MFSRYNTMHSRGNPSSVLMGITGIAFGILFFLQKLNLFSTAFEISDTVFLYFFAGFTLIAAIMLLFRAIAMVGMHY